MKGNFSCHCCLGQYYVFNSAERLQNENILEISVNNIRTAVMYSPLKGTINGAPYSLFLTNVFASPPQQAVPICLSPATFNSALFSIVSYRKNLCHKLKVNLS